jgi:hypothetical protein
LDHYWGRYEWLQPNAPLIAPLGRKGLRKTNLDLIFSESRFGTIAHKNKKKIRQALNVKVVLKIKCKKK